MSEAQSDVGNYVVPSADATPVNLGNLGEYGVGKNEPMDNFEKHFSEADVETTGPLKRPSINSHIDPAQFEGKVDVATSGGSRKIFLKRLFQRRELRDAA